MTEARADQAVNLEKPQQKGLLLSVDPNVDLVNGKHPLSEKQMQVFNAILEPAKLFVDKKPSSGGTVLPPREIAKKAEQNTGVFLAVGPGGKTLIFSEPQTSYRDSKNKGATAFGINREALQVGRQKAGLLGVQKALDDGLLTLAEAYSLTEDLTGEADLNPKVALQIIDDNWRVARANNQVLKSKQAGVDVDPTVGSAIGLATMMGARSVNSTPVGRVAYVGVTTITIASLLAACGAGPSQVEMIPLNEQAEATITSGLATVEAIEAQIAYEIASGTATPELVGTEEAPVNVSETQTGTETPIGFAFSDKMVSVDSGAFVDPYSPEKGINEATLWVKGQMEQLNLVQGDLYVIDYGSGLAYLDITKDGRAFLILGMDALGKASLIGRPESVGGALVIEIYQMVNENGEISYGPLSINSNGVLGILSILTATTDGLMGHDFLNEENIFKLAGNKPPSLRAKTVNVGEQDVDLGVVLTADQLESMSDEEKLSLAPDKEGFSASEVLLGKVVKYEGSDGQFDYYNLEAGEWATAYTYDALAPIPSADVQDTILFHGDLWVAEENEEFGRMWVNESGEPVAVEYTFVGVETKTAVMHYHKVGRFELLYSLWTAVGYDFSGVTEAEANNFVAAYAAGFSGDADVKQALVNGADLRVIVASLDDLVYAGNSASVNDGQRPLILTINNAPGVPSTKFVGAYIDPLGNVVTNGFFPVVGLEAQPGNMDTEWELVTLLRSMSVANATSIQRNYWPQEELKNLLNGLGIEVFELSR